VIAPCSPADCFAATIEAFAVATGYMTPVFLLSDGYIANGSEPWLIPDYDKLPKFNITHPTEKNSETAYLPYKRDEKLVRPWALPGVPGLEHRIGGLEKEDVTGNVSYDPANHEHMVKTRAAKVAGIKPIGPDLIWTGPESGELLIVGWGSTYGAIKAALLQLESEGITASACHIRYLNPLPKSLGERLKRFNRIMVPEMNLGQLLMVLRAKFLIDAKGLNKVRGQPFTIGEIVRAAKQMLAGNDPRLEEAMAETTVAGGG
jgi:2-oxoglutarate ferredoxin oxidoreductase subunit alpha